MFLYKFDIATTSIQEHTHTLTAAIQNLSSTNDHLSERSEEVQ